MLLGAARMLKQAEAQHGELQGTVKLIFQPAEEADGGGQVMVDQGVLKVGTWAPRVACHASLDVTCMMYHMLGQFTMPGVGVLGSENQGILRLAGES